MGAYHPCGETALVDFENYARVMGGSIHTYLADGDRGHKVWCFYTQTEEGIRKYVFDGIRFGYYQYPKG